MITTLLLATALHLGPNIELIPLDDTSWVVNQIKTPYQANALLVASGDHYILVDAKVRDEDAKLLYDWILKRTPKPELTVINSHFHQDSTGTNGFYKSKGATVLASTRTAEILKIAGETERMPNKTFTLAPKTAMTIGKETVEIVYPGPSHAPDNVVVHFPARSLLFGSCLSKLGDDLGNLSDADLKAWRKAMDVVQGIDVNTVVPGHGTTYERGIVANTVRLLDKALR